MARKPDRRRDRRNQYAALPWRRGDRGLEVLLITSRETRRWVVPKGWPMRGKTGSETAAQEALEEAGVRGEIEAAPLGRFGYLKRLKRDRVRPVIVELFPMQVTELLDAWEEQDQRERVWMTPERAAASVDEPELRALIEAFAALDAARA